jgi:TonB family protein
MNDAGEHYAQQIEAARLAADRGDRLAAVEALSAAIETTRTNPGLHREHAAALIRLGTLKQELGRPSEAEQLLIEAIAVGERHLGAEHPSLGVALNELSRLYIRQSDFARAEPVLRRLLQITRAKGDRHPDVATVLAGLAVTKRGLGDHAGAEGLYRYALRIREEVLAPNHMAIVITLEQLGETCAARGNVGEALVHLQRALLRRESALGMEHATVRALHVRIAELQRRASKPVAAVADTPAVPMAAIQVAPAPVAPPIVAKIPTPPAPPPRPTMERRATPVRSRTVASVTSEPSRSSDLVFVYQPEPAAPRPSLPKRERVPSPPTSVAVVVTTPRADSAKLVAPVEDVTHSQIATTSPEWAIPARSRRRTMRYASVGAAVVVLASAGFGLNSHSANQSEQAPAPVAAAPAPVVTPASFAKSHTTVGASAGVAVVRPESLPAATAGGTVAESIATATPPTPVSDAPSTASTAPVALPNLRRLAIPRVAMPNIDSVMRSSAKVARDADSESLGGGVGGGGLRMTASSDEPSVTPPALIGPAPTPRYPDELRAQRLEGEVVVQFRVNEKGRVETSTMQVVRSQHELFTLAVRNVLPKFRFEPARSGARDSKPQAAWVQFRTQFTAQK